MARRDRVGVLITNAFIGMAVDAAIHEINAEPVLISTANQAVDAKLKAVIVDLLAIQGEPLAFINTLLRAGITVLGFGENLPRTAAASMRSQGAILLSRKTLMLRLPVLLQLALNKDQATKEFNL